MKAKNKNSRLEYTLVKEIIHKIHGKCRVYLRPTLSGSLILVENRKSEFVERYMCKTTEETDERIKSL